MVNYNGTNVWFIARTDEILNLDEKRRYQKKEKKEEKGR